jgi:hypothetical protein
MPQISHAQVPPIQISVINESTVLTDADVTPVVNALQEQVSNDFLPVWGIDAELTMVSKGTAPSETSWWLVILDDSDQAGALGYHDLTPNSLPIGKAFAASDLKAGTSWTVTASHELLEMLADPDINLTAFVQNADTTGTLYAYEVCDACEDDSFGYQIDDVLLSDFVYPAWFESFRAQGSTQFDHMNQIKNPLELLKGGYIGVFDVTEGTGWQQQTMEHNLVNVKFRGPVGSRRERRSTPRMQWVTSLPQRRIITNAQQYRQHLQLIQQRREAVLSRGTPTAA